MRATAKPPQQVYKWRSLIAAIDRARTAGIYCTIRQHTNKHKRVGELERSAAAVAAVAAEAAHQRCEE